MNIYMAQVAMAKKLKTLEKGYDDFQRMQEMNNERVNIVSKNLNDLLEALDDNT